jgi:hypothetical protein
MRRRELVELICPTSQAEYFSKQGWTRRLGYRVLSSASRAGRRRGGIAVFDDVTRRQTAHIVVDLQNGFMDHGQMAEVPMARTIVPNVNRISGALRNAGGLGVYLQHTSRTNLEPGLTSAQG